MTWIHFQYEFSAGTTGAAGTYSTVPATNSSTTTGNMTNRPMVRAPVLASTINQHSTAEAQMTEVNSYMLPSGSRPVANPLATIDRMLAARPTVVTTTAARPNRSPQGSAPLEGSAPIAFPSEGLVPPVLVSVDVPPARFDPPAATPTT